MRIRGREGEREALAHGNEKELCKREYESTCRIQTCRRFLASIIIGFKATLAKDGIGYHSCRNTCRKQCFKALKSVAVMVI